MRDPRVDDIFKKYGAKIESQMESDHDDYSKEYLNFRQEMFKEFSSYERWCKSLGSLIKLKFSRKDEDEVQKSLNSAHLDLEPWQALGLSVTAFLSIFLFGLVFSFAYAFISGSIMNFPWLFFVLFLILALFVFYFFKAYPLRLANQWRLKASSQMVPAILYIVVYMRHTSNLEKAIAFASKHLQYPLALDFRKVFYEVEVGKFSTIKESLDNYLESWRGYSPEFIESFHLIEGSLFEPEDGRRISILEKALQVVLDGVYDKMLRFTHEVRGPLSNVYMLGVVLPTLGLALLPLASAMIGDFFKWYHALILFNLIVPFLVFYLTDKILFLRPGGHGETEFLERNPLYAEYASKKHYFNAFLIVLPLLIIGLIPILFGFTPLPDALGIPKDFTFNQIGLGFMGDQNFFDFRNGPQGIRGPFGLGSIILGMFFPLGIALFFAIAYSGKTKKLILEREKTNELEKEFNNSLFQLGNRIGNGTPPELAFGRIAEASRGLITEDFFKKVNYNVQQMGMSVETAIFDRNRGALIYYPSGLIATSMKILVESSKKGLKIAASSLMSISEYVKNIQKITERLKDLLAEVISDMKSNMTFLAPLLAGVVVGLAGMITLILAKLNIPGLDDAVGVGNLSSLKDIFDIYKMIPPYILQISVGIYLIQIIFILTSSLVTVDSGEDKLEKSNKTGRNLKAGMLLYFITGLITTVALSLLVGLVLGGALGG